MARTSFLSFVALFIFINVAECELEVEGILEGVNLRCCTLVESPIVFESFSPRADFPFRGIAIEYLEKLQKLLRFKCETLKVFNATDPVNQGFNGFVREMESCTENGAIRKNDPNCQCDIGTGGWAFNNERFEKVDYVESFMNNDFRILTHVDELQSDVSGAFFITAFSTGSWGLIIVLLTCFIVLKLLDGRFSPVQTQFEPRPQTESRYKRTKHFMLKSPMLYRIRRSTQSVLKGALGQPSSEIPGDSKSTRQWLLNYILLLCGLFLVLSYEAVMTYVVLFRSITLMRKRTREPCADKIDDCLDVLERASLVQEELVTDFRSLNDIQQCNLIASDICVPKGGATENLWNSAIATTRCHRKENAPKPILVDSYEIGHEMVANKTCRFFMASGATTEDAANGKFCRKVKTTGEPFFAGDVSFLLPYGSSLTSVFTRATLNLRAEGKLESLDKYFQVHSDPCTFHRSISLTVDRLKIFFFMAFGACGALMLIMVCDPHGIRKFDGDQKRSDIEEGLGGKEDVDCSDNSESDFSFAMMRK